jgi:uncharacterized protein (UPF0218 family)
MQLKSGSKYIVDERLREEIASTEPRFCTINDIREFSKTKRIITVGDVTTENVRKSGITPFLQVVDLKSRRGAEGEFQHLEGSIEVESEPGTISHDLFSVIKECLEGEKPSRIEVTGEEDLAVIPIIFYSELDTVVVYGVPGVGMACIEVNSDSRRIVNDLINRMEIK